METEVETDPTGVRELRMLLPVWEWWRYHEGR